MKHTDNPHARPHRALDGEVAALLGIGGGEAHGLPFSGVRALMLAMLEDAVRAYVGGEPRPRAEAAGWIDSGRSRWVFSFNTVCETLGLEPTAVRVAVRRLRDQAPGGRRFAVGKSRPNARQANLRITLPRVRRHATVHSAGGSTIGAAA
jgi:hypothetical protein